MRVLQGCFFLLLCLVQGLAYDQAKCRYMCDDPVCNALCDALCEAPRCNIPAPYTNSLECEIRCPPSACLQKDACPSCTIKAVNATQNHLCLRFCSAPVCACACRKPSDCPVPRCQLMCDQHSCESQSTVQQPEVEEPVPAETDNEQAPEIQLPPADPQAGKQRKQANNHYYDDDDYWNDSTVDNGGWVFFWVFMVFFFICLVIFAFSYSYGYGPNYWYDEPYPVRR